jgi:hypothetical protein
VKRRLFGMFALLLAVPAHTQPAEQGNGAQISPVQGEPNKNAGNKPDRSLIPGLQAELKAALDEAASAKDTALAAKKELDQRMTENNHWKDEIALLIKTRPPMKAKSRTTTSRPTRISLAAQNSRQGAQRKSTARQLLQGATPNGLLSIRKDII